MFKSLLIANRGEIARRIIRTAREMGLRTIAVYSDADAEAAHVVEADEAVHIGPSAARESYLVIEKIIAAAKASGAEAIHPGYGFLSENVAFAEACSTAGLIFVGPPADAIRAMGLKDAAKALMEKAGVPVVPGYHGAEQDVHFLEGEAETIGYPVLIKAVAGGGGKGMRRVDKPADFADALAGAQREAQNAFGDAHVLIEKYVARPRHIEIQVFADGQGNAVSLFERDCSLQRRHQKVVEEAPAPDMPEAMRKAMGDAAVAAAKAIGYRGAGTVEFIADASDGLKADGFWFMEMNTRLQVEHPVTEAITGLDLVEWQLRVAAGDALPMTQDQLAINGHAVEVRLYAEDPNAQFLPSTGKLIRLRAPDTTGIRMDMGVREGDAVSVFYDPMIGKIISHAPTRAQALQVLARHLRGMEVAGPRTNLEFLAAIAEHPAFVAGDIDTGFIERHLDVLLPGSGLSAEVMGLAVIGMMGARARDLRKAQAGRAEVWSPWVANDQWVLGGHRPETIHFSHGGQSYDVVVTPVGPGWHMGFDGSSHVVSGMMSHDGDIRGHVDGRGLKAGYIAHGDGFSLTHEGGCHVFGLPDPLDVEMMADGATGALTAPMPGKMIQVLAEAGQDVKKGTALAVMEAMKMEQTLLAAADGRVASVHVAVGDQVESGAVLVRFEDIA
ncbi:MAG: acetyl-CoA carboxylase biotin carboxylase subunit [Rhizobiales bacterium]|nr:acetyl-CoA carboxylase biotin carboxylase subunit [Hyphomicrobiales bacterium]